MSLWHKRADQDQNLLPGVDQSVPADSDVQGSPVVDLLPAVDVNPGNLTKLVGYAVVTSGTGHHQGGHTVTVLPPVRYRSENI